MYKVWRAFIDAGTKKIEELRASGDDVDKELADLIDGKLDEAIDNGLEDLFDMMEKTTDSGEIMDQMEAWGYV